MTSLIILIGIAAVLWLAVFSSKRRFGVLGLALTAGATVSTLWSYEAGLLVASLGLVPQGPLTDAVVLSVITILPACLLFFHGHAHKTIVGRIIGATLFVAMAMALLIEPIGIILPVSGGGAQAYAFLKEYGGVIISVGVVLAVIDILSVTSPAAPEKSSKKSHK